MKKTKIKGAVFLLLTAFIWGVAFVAQSVGMESVEAFTFGAVRTMMGVAALLPVILIKDHIASKKMTDKQLDERKLSNKKALVYGSLLGVVFCLASSLQQQAFNYSDAGKIAFITAIYIFFVPLLGLFFKNKVSALMWGCVAIGFVGLYFLCIDGQNLTAINLGDVLSLVCAFFFAIHILLIEKFTVGTDGLKLSCVQFFVSGVISTILMFLFESPSWSAILTAIVPLLYAGVLSCGVAYTLQIIGQKYTDSAMASLIMCMESVFAVLASSLLLHERMSTRETVGCIIMFAAILLPNLVAIVQQRKR
jgi:drug/metabolite transporter (DMT)-like permease